MIFTGPYAQKRFKSLREKYSREKRRQQLVARSGSAASSAGKWVYYDSLQFFDPFMAARSTFTNDAFGDAERRYDDEDEGMHFILRHHQ